MYKYLLPLLLIGCRPTPVIDVPTDVIIPEQEHSALKEPMVHWFIRPINNFSSIVDETIGNSIFYKYEYESSSPVEILVSKNKLIVDCRAGSIFTLQCFSNENVSLTCPNKMEFSIHCEFIRD